MGRKLKPGKERLSKPLKSGGRGKHYGYSFLAKAELPKSLREVQRYLSSVRSGLIDDLSGGGGEQALSTGQIVLIDRVISLLGCVRCMEFYMSSRPIIEKGHLSPVLGRNFISYNNAVRVTLLALGIERRAADRILSPDELARIVDAEEGVKS